MTAIQTCIDFYNVNSKSFNKLETMIIEGMLFQEICEYLYHFIQKQTQSYFELIHFYPEKEPLMIQAQLIQFLIQDILATNQYTLSGIAYYTDTPIDTLFEIIAGTNMNPSLLLTQKLLALHRSLKPDFYRDILNKLTYRQTLATEYVAVGF